MLLSKAIRNRGLLLQKQYKQTRCCSQAQVTDEEKEKELERIAREASIDDPPTSCCMSGCANCVFIVWAEALSVKMQNAGPEIAQKILEKVDDPSMRAYLEMELRIRLKK
ncbi:hypothetical protein K1T71_006980 [Dendrolimus kikuchii]|uniref:Uncharacterized protein n=1 Tax=Dendrolimus kikuchii TaxID=765133 RepID=A0ACC1CZ42_9NEOP|nr:hypothetical protein K1T71_006980 [Dendrolimus kikuchii]